MEAKKLVTEIGHAEGPTVLDDGRVVYCQCYDGKLGVWSPDGTIGIYAAVGGGPNGTVLGSDGCLYVANNGGAVGAFRSEDYAGGFIQKVHPDGRTEVALTEIGGRRLNMPNDLTFGADGRLYFTDPGAWSPEDESQKDDGFIMAASPDGSGEILVEVGKAYPNGIAAEKDGSIVWVETYTRRVRRRRPDGSLEDVLTWENERHLPDGLAVADNGDLYIATLSSGGFHVVSPDGSRQHVIDLGGTTLSNITFSGTNVFLTDLGSKPAATEEQVYYGQLLHVDLGVEGMPMFRGSIETSR